MTSRDDFEAMGDRMPHTEPLAVADLQLDAETILELLGPRLPERRRERIEEVVASRTYEVATVLDGIYDRGNVSAVIRTAEALGYQSMHVVESQEHFKEANRVTQGTDKWLDIERYDRPAECLDVLRDRGYRVAATDLQASRSLSAVEVDEPTALVFGNEKDGVSEPMLEAADVRFRVPMVGFAQSYNISVGAAITLYDVFERRVEQLGSHGDLDAGQRELLRARYYLKSVDEPERLLRGLLRRRE